MSLEKIIADLEKEMKFNYDIAKRNLEFLATAAAAAPAAMDAWKPGDRHAVNTTDLRGYVSMVEHCFANYNAIEGAVNRLKMEMKQNPEGK